MKAKRLFIALGVSLALAFCFFSCDTPTYYEYVFANETDHTIYVKLSEEYKVTEESETMTTSELYLYGKTSVTVFVENGSADFSWRASSTDNNRNIYTVVKGPKVTFRGR